MTFHLTCVHIMLSSVWVAEWPSFGKKLLTHMLTAPTSPSVSEVVQNI